MPESKIIFRKKSTKDILKFLLEGSKIINSRESIIKLLKERNLQLLAYSYRIQKLAQALRPSQFAD